MNKIGATFPVISVFQRIFRPCTLIASRVRGRQKWQSGFIGGEEIMAKPPEFLDDPRAWGQSSRSHLRGRQSPVSPLRMDATPSALGDETRQDPG